MTPDNLNAKKATLHDPPFDKLRTARSTVLSLGVWLIVLLVAASQLAAKPRPRVDRVRAQRAASAADAERIPKALSRYKGRRIAQTMHYDGAPWLVRESRDREEDTKTMLRELNLEPGMVVCDMGCGNGFYTIPMAQIVGAEGRVLAVDIQPEMLHLLDLRAKQEGVTNIEPILGTLIDPKLPEHSLDLILLVDVYHELSHPEHMLRAMRRALKPEGRIALVEFRLEDPKVPIKLLHKMSKKQIMKEFPANGFELVREFDDLPWQHLMFFQATGEDPTDPADDKNPAEETLEQGDESPPDPAFPCC